MEAEHNTCTTEAQALAPSTSRTLAIRLGHGNRTRPGWVDGHWRTMGTHRRPRPERRLRLGCWINVKSFPCERGVFVRY